MNQKHDQLAIVSVYYADCDQEAGLIPRWSTARSIIELDREGGIPILRQQIETIKKKKKSSYQFGEEVIEIDDPPNEKVQSILEAMLLLPHNNAALPKLKALGDILAKKYLKTQYSRTRLFILAQAMEDNQPVIFGLVSDLTTEHTEEYIKPNSHEFAIQVIRNRIGELKKGMKYPLTVDGQRSNSGLSIFDSNKTVYYPKSLECIPKQNPETEVRSFFKVVADAVSLTGDQTGNLIRSLRETDRPTIGSTDLVEILEQNEIMVDRDKITDKWRKEYSSSEYNFTPAIFSQDDVLVTVLLDEFEIRCPLSYFPDRISIREKGGYTYLELRGREYRGIKMGNAVLDFTD